MVADIQRQKDNGYIQIAPVVDVRTRAKKGEPKKLKPRPQNAHRLVVLAYKRSATILKIWKDLGTWDVNHCDSEEEVERMLAGAQASHLCHQPTCINPDHIVVEPKETNEGRKACRRLGLVVVTEIEGRTYRLEPEHQCACPEPKCIFMVERREAKLQ